jgi:flavodoxin
MFMKIGIIVHSFTGNTLAVAQEIQNKLVLSGHIVEVERIEISGGEQPNNTQFQIENPPDVNKYDALIIGAPVRGFSVSPVIATYLKQVASLKDKKVFCFITKQLNSYWTGGRRAINTMKDLCEAKEGIVTGTGVIFWKSKNRDQEIELLAERISSQIVGQYSAY